MEVIRVADIITTLKGELVGETTPEALQRTIVRLVDASQNNSVADATSVVVVSAEKFIESAKASGAGLVVAEKNLADRFSGLACVRVENGYQALATLSQMLVPLSHAVEKNKFENKNGYFVEASAQIHPDAILGPGVVVGRNTRIGASVRLGANAVIGADCEIGDFTEIFPGVVIYDRVKIGKHTRIHAKAVIGADGFGYAGGARGPIKINHGGGVRIGDYVEIGAGTTIDQGTFSPTQIGNMVKIDNLVQVGHNCKVGDASIICGMTGLPGGVEIGRGVTIGGMVGFNNRVKVGDFSQVGGMTGVSKDLPAKSKVIGRPMNTLQEFYRLQILISRLPELFKEVKQLKEKIFKENI